MVVSELISILNAILKESGDIGIELYIDKRQFSNPYSGMKESDIIVEDLQLVKVKEDNTGIYLSNEYRITDDYKGCSCDVRYNPETGIYEGVLIPPEYIEGFQTRFTAPDKFTVKQAFIQAAEEYLDFMSNAKVTKTIQAVDNIKKEMDLDYGEIEEYDNDDPEDDGDYGEV